MVVAIARFIAASPRKYVRALIFSDQTPPLPVGMSTMSRGKEIIETWVCLAFTLSTMIESVSLPIPRLSRDAFESVPRTSTVMRFERSGLGFGFGVGAGVGLAVGDGLSVGIGDGLGVAEACATCFGATTAVQATTTTMSTATATIPRPIQLSRARANIGRHDTRCMQSREVTVRTV